MKRFRGFFGSALLAFVLLFSIASQPVTTAARRCPVRIPDSLLTLYLKSDLIVSGSITGEKFLKKTQEYDYGYYFDVEKNLRVSKTLKGVEADSTAFVVSDFKSARGENADVETDRYAMDAGEEALFFLVKNDDNSYALTDYVSGMKPLNATDLSIYEKRVEELKRITAAKKNQMSKLAEWLVQLVEDPVTRGDGLLDLNDSFGALEYESEEKANGEETIKTKEPIVLDKSFRAETAPEIAKLLTASQKQRLSTAFLNALNDDLIKIHNGAAEEEQLYPDYRFTNLVGNWDKNYLAMSSFAFLLNTNDADSRRIMYLMRVITNFLDDEELYEIVTEYESALAEPDDAKTDYTEKVEIIETENLPENETITETTEPAVEEVEENPAAVEMPETSEAVDKEAEKITFKEYRGKLLAKFSRQYGIAVSQSSASN